MSILIIKMCGSRNESEECEMIATQAKIYGLTPTIIDPKDHADLERLLVTDTPYDFLYISAHGSHEGVCNHAITGEQSFRFFVTEVFENFDL